MFRFYYPIIVLCSALVWACGQQDLILPESKSLGECGEGYPAASTEKTNQTYALEEGAVFPCFLMDSVALDQETTYVSFSELYLQAKHDKTDGTSVVIVIGAQNCPACEVLMTSLSKMADDLDDRGALMMAAVFCDNYDRTQCDFDLERAVLVAGSEGWPTDRWWVTNDAEAHFKPSFTGSFPTAIVIRLSDMNVVRIDKSPKADELFHLVNTLHK